VGEIEPGGQYLPDDAEHDMHVDEDNAPKVIEYLPATQMVQEAEFVCDVEPENFILEFGNIDHGPWHGPFM
jgi:hypothetical protein